MKQIIRSLLIAAVLTLSIGSLGVGVTSAIDSKKAVCEGIGIGGGSTDCSEDPDAPGVSSSISRAIDIFSWIAGIAAVIVVIVGGFKYITSAGDSNGVSSAKNTIMYALIGLVIVAFAQVIVKFVVKKFTT